MNLVANQMANLRVTNQMGKILGVRVLVESLVADVVIFFEILFSPPFRSRRVPPCRPLGGRIPNSNLLLLLGARVGL